MAIAFDTSGYQTGGSDASRTVSVAANGADRVAIVAAMWISDTYDTPTLTVGGSSAGVVQIGSMFQHPSTGTKKCAIFRYVAPPTSATNYVATWGGNTSDSALGVLTYTGVDQTTPITGSLTTNSAVGANPTITVSSATGEVVVAGGFGWYPVGNSGAADGGQNSRILQRNWSGNGSYFGLSDKAGAGSVTLSWTSSSGDWSALAVRLAEAAGGGGTAATTRYNSFAEDMADGIIDLDNDTFKVCLVTSSYTPSLTHTQLSDVSSNRVSGTTDVALTSVTWARSGGTATFDAADTDSLFSSTGTPKYAVIYSDTSTNDKLVGYVTLPDSTTITSGDTLRLVWDAAGIFTLA